MSVVLYKAPNTIDLVNNKLFFKVKGTDYIITEGEKAGLYMIAHSMPAEDEQMALTFLGQSHIFQFTSDTTQVLPEGVHCWLPRSSYQDIYIHLSNYLPISQSYNVSFNNANLFVLSALVGGTAYNITFDLITAWELVSQDGTQGDYRPNYHFLVQFFVNSLSDTGTFTALPEFRIDPDNDQISNIEVGQLIKPRFRNNFELPDFSLALPSKALIPTLSYYMIVKEMSGVNLVSSLTTSTFKAINGKVNNADHPRFNLRTWINAQKKFLSNMPSQVYTWYGAKHYLNYLSPFANTTNLRVKIEINSKNSEDPQEYISDTIAMNQDEILIVPVTQMLADVATPEKLVYASVSLINDADGTVADAITFFYLNKTLYNRAFLFQNRLGGFDTIITSVQANTFKVKKTEKRQILTPDYSPYIGDLSSDEPELEDTFTAETVPVSGAMAQHYKEMAASNVVFLQSDDRFIRVYVEPGSFKAVDEDKDLHPFKFKYKPMFDGDILSTELNLPEPPHEDYSQEYLKTDYL